MDGGLNEESRMNSVLGDWSLDGESAFCGAVVEGDIVFNTRNLESEFWNFLRAEPSSVTSGRKVSSLFDMCSSVILSLSPGLLLSLV